MANIFTRFFAIAKRHKIISAIVLIILLGCLYMALNYLGGTNIQTKYVLAKAEKGTIISSLSSSGQVSALNSTDIKAKVSDNVVYVGVKEGDSVKAGRLIVQLDTADAEKTVRQAEENLESAQIALQKLAGLNTLPIPLNKQQAQDDLNQAYDDGFNDVADAFLDLPTIMTGLQSTLFGSDLNKTVQNIDFYVNFIKNYDTGNKPFQYRDSAYNSYQTALASYNKNFSDYKATSRSADQTAVDLLIDETFITVQAIADALKDSNNLIRLYEDTATAKNQTPISASDTQLANLNTYTGKTNTHLSSLKTAQNTIKNAKDAISNADLDVQSQKLSLQKAEDSLAEAKNALKDYYIYAPFNGIVSAVNVKVGDTASGTVASMVTNTMAAEISFGETDIVKIKIGQKANLTFDAVSDLTITGKVSAIDVVGTNSQGVVSYNVKVVMDVQDEKIRPGMSTTATIITGTKTDALYVPNSAVKTQQGEHYVLKVQDTTTETAPQRQVVQTGLSDDSSTEIISGLSEGDVIVSKTVTSASASKATTSSNNDRPRGVMMPGL